MPDLGQYAGPVLNAYAVSVLLLLIIVFISVKRARTIRRQLEVVEQRREKKS